MNIWSFLFGAKDEIKYELATQTHLHFADSTKLNPLPNHDDVVADVEKPKKLYPFTPSYSFENMSKLVKYWYDNIEKWENKYDLLEHGNIKKSIDSLQSHISYKNSDNFELTFFPNNCYNWFSIKADGYGKLKCSLNHSSFIPFRGEPEYLNLKSNRLDTNAKIYDFFYDLTINMKFSASDSFKLKNYCKKHKLPTIVKGLRFYKINGGEYYIYTTKYKYEEGFSRLHDIKIKNSYYYRTNIHRFSDWEIIEESYQSFLEHFGEEPVIEECQDPKTEFWQHFTKIEIEKKVAFMNKCKEFVNEVYKDQAEYSKLMKDAGMDSPFPKIGCYSTMLSFCENINKQVPYNEHDINTAIAKLKEDVEIQDKKGELK